MNYSVQQLATLAGVSVRTLHHYDQVGLLTPGRRAGNQYRVYTDADVLTLQHILFWRELDFSVSDIKRMLQSPGFNPTVALRDQRHLLRLKQKRLTKLIATIDRTLKNMNDNHITPPHNLKQTFDSSEIDQYADEARQRWGHTDAYKQSQERVQKMGKAGLQKVMEDNQAIYTNIVQHMNKGSASIPAQNLIAQHYNGLRAFYEPSPEMYRGLAETYVSDPRFTAFYEKIAPGLAQFMHDAMIYFVEKGDTKIS